MTLSLLYELLSLILIPFFGRSKRILPFDKELLLSCFDFTIATPSAFGGGTLDPVIMLRKLFLSAETYRCL